MCIRLWLDDVRSPPDESWLVAKTAAECIAFLQTVCVDVLSLDHDLGEPENGTGYDVVMWMEEQSYTNPQFNPPPEIKIHSANPVGRSKMYAGIAAIRKIIENRNNT